MEHEAIYLHACPNCGGPEDDARLMQGLPCTKCLPTLPKEEPSVSSIGKMLRKLGTLKKYKELMELDEKYRSVERLFHKATGSRLWSAQRTWVKRVLMGKSFSVIAPTGVGKTTFGILMALYFAAKKSKSYIVLPTTPLILQVERKAREMAEKAGVDASILAIHSRLSKKSRAEAMEKLGKGDFNILITTSKFLQARFNDIAQHHYRFIFVDDVDAVLKSSKSVDLVLKLLGFTDEDLSVGMEAVKARIRLARAVASARSSEEIEEAQREWSAIEQRLRAARRRVKSILVVSSATGRPRGSRVKLFRELLGFEAGSRSEVLRRIVDSYYKPEEMSLEEAVGDIVKRLGSGGLVYVPVDKGIDYAEKLADILRGMGVRAEAFHSKRLRTLEAFANGDIDVLVGVAVYYGVMVRGLDLPQRIRYAVFAGVPRLKFSTEFEDPHPSNIYKALSILVEVTPEDLRHRLEITLVRVRRMLQRLSPAALQIIAEHMRSGQPPASPAENVFHEALELVREALARSDVREALRTSGDIAVIEEKGKTYIMIPDIMTYIQASGRTSRLYAGGITRGLSVVIVDDERLLRGLMKRSRWIIEDAEWQDFRTLILEPILREIDEDREKVRKILEGKVPRNVEDIIRTALFIVESPNKARTIAGFFGKPSVRRIGEAVKVYEVSTGDYMLLITASGGHVYDLAVNPPKTLGGEDFHGVIIYSDNGSRRFIPVYNSIRRCMVCGHQFTSDTDKCPRCGSTLVRNSLENVDTIRGLALEVDEVLIGTDPDTEGEKIAWDLAVLLQPYTRNIRRVEFHEVTRRAILEALRNPRNLNTNLVEAQMLRRIEDRWIGFTLSPLLWYKFWPTYCATHIGDKEKCRQPNRNLSAGRVQTPVLGWIIDRYNEYKNSVKKIFLVGTSDKRLFLEFTEDELPPGVKPSDIKNNVITVSIVGVEEREVKPLPPFTTDAMLSEASARLRLGAEETMRLAQDLFEMGFITYHRTDSTRISDAGIMVAREYLKEKYGDRYTEFFAPRRWGEGGAHEAIRPTRPVDAERLVRLIEEGIIQPVRPLTKRHLSLYRLIFERFIASQMKPGKIKVQIAKASLLGVEKKLENIIEVVEPGFLDMYMPFRLSAPLEPGRYKVDYTDIRKKALKPLYTQGDVVRLMKDRGIGRPSTYAKIMQTLLKRHYVVERGRLNKLVPTLLGREVYSYLTERSGEGIAKLVSEERTAMLEKLMDLVEAGEKSYLNVLNELYDEIYPIYLELRREVGEPWGIIE